MPTQDIVSDRQQCASYAFGQFTLDAGNFELRRGGESVTIQRKVFDVLHYLITRAGQVVTRDELLDTLWPGEYVTESALAFSISHVRRAISQARTDKTPIETIRGRGFRFVDPVVRTLPDGAERPRPAARPPSDFIGRSAVLSAAHNALVETAGGSGALWLLRGEAGIGKTRCCEEIAALARASGLSVWWGRCPEDESAPALWPFIQVLRSCATDSGIAQELATRAQALATELASPPSAQAAASDDATDTTPFWMLDRVAVLLDEATRLRPALIVIDDLHQADEMSLRLLRLCAPDLPSRHMIILGTVRPHETSTATAGELLEQCMQRGVCHDLSPFDLGEVETCVQRALGQVPPPALLEALRQRTAGNPLFLVEALRFLKARHGDDWAAVDVARLELPRAVRNALTTRLSQLPPALLEMLTMASVLGERFELSVLEALVAGDRGGGNSSLLDLLDDAEGQHLIRPDGGVTRYAFDHAVIREMLYEGLSSSQRVELHARVAEVLESVAVGGDRLREVAFHLHRALPGGGGERLVGVAEQAAGAARRVGAHADAARLLGWALEAESLRSPPLPHAQCRLLLSQGAAYLSAGKHAEGRKALREVVDLADEHGHGELLLSAAKALRPTKLWARMQDELALRCLEAARSHLPSSDLPHRIRVLCELSVIPPYSRSAARASALIDEAAELAAQLGSPVGDLHVLQARMASMTGPDDADALLRACDEVLEHAKSVPPGRTVLDALMMRFHTHMQLGDFEAGQAALAEFGEIARRTKDFTSIWHYDRCRIQLLVFRGEFVAAEEQGTVLVRRAARADLPMGQWFELMHAVALLQNRRGASAVLASPLFAPLREMARATPFQQAWLLSLWADAGEPQALREGFESVAQHGFGDRIRDLDYLPNLCLYARAAVALGDRPRMALIAQRLAPYPQRMAIGAFAAHGGQVGHYLGMLYRGLGESERAVELLRAAARRNHELGLLGCALDSQLELASALADLAQTAEARELARDVQERSTQLDMLGLAGRAELLL